MNFSSVLFILTLAVQFVKGSNLIDQKSKSVDTTSISIAITNLLQDYYMPLAKVISITSEASFNDFKYESASRDVITKVMQSTSYNVAYRFVTFNDRIRTLRHRTHHLIFVDQLDVLL